MSNLLQSSAKWLGKQLRINTSRSVDIMRGGTTLLMGLKGTCSEIAHEVMDVGGVGTVVKSFDWTFKAIDLGDYEPQQGDVIEETLNGYLQRYSVHPFDPMPLTEWLDSSGILIVIHTRRIR